MDTIDDKLTQITSHQSRDNRRRLQNLIGANLNEQLKGYETQVRESGSISDTNAFVESVKTALVDSIKKYLNAESVPSSDIDFYKIWERDVLATMFNFDAKSLTQQLHKLGEIDYDQILAGIISNNKQSVLRYLDRDSERVLGECLESPTGRTKLHEWAKMLVPTTEGYSLTPAFMHSRDAGQVLGALKPFFMNEYSRNWAQNESHGFVKYESPN